MDEVPRRFASDYRVRFDEAGADGLLRASGFLRYAQDLAWVHSESAGFDREWYRRRGLQWLVRCIELELAEPVPYGAVVAVTTEVTGWRRVWARRSSGFRVQGQRREVGRATIDWVLLNSAGRPARIPDEIATFFSDGETFEPGRVAIGSPPEDAHAHAIPVRPSDVDPMGHVNNATYLDYLDETLGAAGAGDATVRLPRSYAIEYLRPALPGGDLEATVWPESTGWAYRLVDADGSELARARLKVSS